MSGQILAAATRQDPNDLTQTRRSRLGWYKAEKFVGSEGLLIGSDSGPAGCNILVQRFQETYRHCGVKVRRGFFSIWSRRRIGIAGIGMSQPRWRRERPTPPASPGKSRKKSPQRRRQPRRWQFHP